MSSHSLGIICGLLWLTYFLPQVFDILKYNGNISGLVLYIYLCEIYRQYIGTGCTRSADEIFNLPSTTRFSWHNNLQRGESRVGRLRKGELAGGFFDLSTSPEIIVNKCLSYIPSTVTTWRCGSWTHIAWLWRIVLFIRGAQLGLWQSCGHRCRCRKKDNFNQQGELEMTSAKDFYCILLFVGTNND